MFIITSRNKQIIAFVSPDVARTAGIDVRWLDIHYLEAFALTIALGLRFLGVLLMGALIRRWDVSDHQLNTSSVLRASSE